MNDETYELTLDAAREPSEAVVEAVAEREGVAPTEVPPLYDVINPDALDKLFRRRESGRVTVKYAGYEVTVRGRDRVSVSETEA